MVAQLFISDVGYKSSSLTHSHSMAVDRVDHPGRPDDQPSGECEHDNGGKNDMPTLNMPAFLHDDRPPTVGGITHPPVEWSRVLNSTPPNPA
jgi:hypothetical protein